MIDYKGYEIPNTKEEILNISTQFRSNTGPHTPWLHYPIKGTSIFINMTISAEKFYDAEGAELHEYIGKYVQIAKDYIDAVISRNA